jgi:Immunoglobulin I-set domain
VCVCVCVSPARATAQPPRFVDRLTNLTVVEGQPVQFTTEAVGVPVPMMSWQKDGRMLSDADDGGRYRIQTEGGWSSLQIAAAKPEDSAWFQCSAVSVAGTAANRARLVVQGTCMSALANRHTKNYITRIPCLVRHETKDERRVVYCWDFPAIVAE